MDGPSNLYCYRHFSPFYYQNIFSTVSLFFFEEHAIHAMRNDEYHTDEYHNGEYHNDDGDPHHNS